MPARLSAAACLVVATLAYGGPTTQPVPPAPGETAPTFTLNTIDGKAVALTDLEKGGPVVLIELRGWVGYQCPICSKQVHAFVGEAEAFKAAGAHVVLIYPGAAKGLQDHAADFVSGKGLPDGFSFVLDPGTRFVSDYSLRWDAANENDYPATFVIDRGGIVRFAQVSHTHGGRATPPQVLAALAALG